MTTSAAADARARLLARKDSFWSSLGRDVSNVIGSVKKTLGDLTKAGDDESQYERMYRTLFVDNFEEVNQAM